jgi:AraC-like DNA-binding protein
MRGTVSTALVRFVLAGLQTAGADPGALARRAGLPVWTLGDNTARIPGVQLARVLQESRAQLADPRLGSHLGSQWRFGALHLYDYLIATATTLGEALTVSCSYLGIVNEHDGQQWLIEEDDRVTLGYPGPPDVDPDIQAVVVELGLSVGLTRIRQLLRQDIVPLHVELAAAPAGHRDLAGALGARRVDLGAGRSAVSFARADLSVPMPGADPGLAALLRRHADALIAAPGITPRWIDRFRQVLAARLAAGELSLGVTAAQLGMSPRTLQRRLDREGTSWRGEVDALRREQAGWLAREGLSGGAIAARLGYSDARVLRRAARRWDRGGPGGGPGGGR